MRSPLDRYDVARDAASLGLPALLVHGEDDRRVPPACSARIADAWPGARLHLVPGLGHRRILEDPRVLALIVDALSELGAQGPRRARPGRR